MVTSDEFIYYLFFVFDLINPTSYNYTVKPPTRLNISAVENTGSGSVGSNQYTVQ